MEPDGGNAAGAAEVRSAAGAGDAVDVDGAVASGASPPTNEELTAQLVAATEGSANMNDDDSADPTPPASPSTDLQNAIDSSRRSVAEANAAMAEMEESDKKVDADLARINEAFVKLGIEPTDVGLKDLSRPDGMKIAAVFDRYRKLRHRVDEENGTNRWEFWQHGSRRAQWKSPSAGPGTLLLRFVLREEIGCDVGLREELILEAAHKGYLYLVRELLCPTPYDGHTVAKSPPAVSMNATDDKRNTILHLAVQGGNAPLVHWLLRYSKTYFQSKEMDRWDWNSALNDNLQTPLSLAIKRGNMRVLNVFLRGELFHIFPSAISYAFDLPHQLGVMEKLDVTDDTSAFVQGDIDVPVLVEKVSTKLQQLVDDKRHNDGLFQCLAFFEARHHASRAARNAVDKWMRSCHLKHFQLNSYARSDGAEKYSLPRIKEVLGGRSCPWWNTELSDFNLEDYIESRSKAEKEYFFSLLCSSVEVGHFDSALWLLGTFKAPPSVMSYRNTNNGLWYLNVATKIAEKAILGWVDNFVAELLKSTGDTRSLYGPAGKIVERKLLPRSKEYNLHGTYYADGIPEKMIHFAQSKNLGKFWNDIWDQEWKNTTSKGEHEEDLFGVDAKVFVATMLAGQVSLESFEQSGHGKLISYFLETSYAEESGFTAADLPRLSCFVALDLLVFFQFLCKERTKDNIGEKCTYLDLNIPLLWTPASELRPGNDEIDTSSDESDEDECVICLECMSNPYTLTCGHRFHQQCLFRYTFPEVREAEDEELDENSSPEERAELAHRVLAGHEDLSFILGFCTCPYCRAGVKPSLPRAFALNLADGLYRTASQRRYAPNSPDLDISECRPGITVGEALLGFAACCGAINIFEWLVKDKGIDPERFGRGDGKNILYFALSHGQFLIVRWLCENGYSHLLFGGLDRDKFDDDALFSHLSSVINEKMAARIDFDEREEDLARRSDFIIDNYEYTDEEKAILNEWGEGLTEEEEAIAFARYDIYQMSPVHMLLMSVRNKICTLHCENAFLYLQQTGKLDEMLPVSWCRLVLTCGTNEKLRNEAKRFLSQQVVSQPNDLDEEALRQQNELGETERTNMTDQDDTIKRVLEFQPDELSILDIAKNVDSFNFWRMAASSIRDWKPFFQIAASLNLWEDHSMFNEDFDMRGEVTRFVGDFVIEGACLPMLVSFCRMKSFTKYFDLFAETDPEYSWRYDISLRKMIKDRNQWEAFSPLFDILDRTKSAKSEVWRTQGRVVEAIHSGKSLEEIMKDIERTRQLALSLPDCTEPFGVDRHSELARLIDPSYWDWLDGFGIRIDEGYKRPFEVLIDRMDAEILHWVLSLLLEKGRRQDEFEETDLVLQCAQKFASSSSTNLLFGLEEILKYFSEIDSSSKYFGKTEDLLVDLIGNQKQTDKEWSFDAMMKNFDLYISRQGLLTNIIGDMFYKCNPPTSSEEGKLAESNPDAWIETAKEKVEKKYRVVEWFLCRPEVQNLLKRPEFVDRFSKHLLSIDYLADASIGPHISFRIMNLFFTHGLNPMVEINEEDGPFMNLVEYVLRKHKRTCGREGCSDIVKMWAEGDDCYKTGSGDTVISAQDLVRWLVLEVGIDIQQFHFNDIKSDSFFDRKVFSQVEWDALKEEQRNKKAAGASPKH